MEKDFLLYLLYIALIDIRGRSYELNDKATFGLCDLLHRLPLQLMHDEGVKGAYADFLKSIEERGLQEWIKVRMEEFHTRYPEYRQDMDIQT